MDMLGLLEDIGVDIRQTHIIHGALVSQVSAVLIITHADGSTGSVLILTDEIACVHTFCAKTCLHEVAETIISNHAAEGHFSTQCRCIRSKDSGGTTQGKGHLLGKLLFTYFRLPFYLIENQIDV